MPDKGIEVALLKDRAFGKDKRKKVVSTIPRNKIARLETRAGEDGTLTLEVCMDKGAGRSFQGVHVGAELTTFIEAVCR